MNSNPKKQSFVKGASILLLAMIVVKVCGAFFKIPIGNILTPVGMAYFNTSYQLFTTVYALSVTGFSSATARMVAAFAAEGRYHDCRRTLRVSRASFLLLGLSGSVLMLFCAPTFSAMVKMPHAQYAMMAMAPAILFSCMMASYRGYYEGIQNMTPTAVSQVVEVLAKLVLGIILSYGTIAYAVRQFETTGRVFGMAVATAEDAVSASLPVAAAAAMIGISASTLAGFLYVWGRFHRSERRCAWDTLPGEQLQSVARSSAGEILMRLFLTALPITLSAVALNLTNMIDVMTITSRLKSIYTENPDYFQALYGAYLSKGQQMHELIYGSYTYALPFFSIVSAFTALFGKSALPSITEAYIRRDKAVLQNNIESVLRMTALVALPAGVGLSVLSKEIILLFHGNISGAVAFIAPSLQILGIAAIFLGFTSPIYAVFQGVGKFFIPLYFVLVGGLAKIAINYFLIGILQVNIKGAAIGSLVCYLLMIILSLAWLPKISGVTLSYRRIFLKPLLASIACGYTAHLVASSFNGNMGLLLSISAAFLCYFLLILLLRSINKYEWAGFPSGDKIVNLLEKLHLLPRD